MMKVGTACDSAAQKTQRAARSELLGCEKSRVKSRLAPLSSAVQHDDAIVNVSYKPFVDHDQLDLMTMVAAVMGLQESTNDLGFGCFGISGGGSHDSGL